MVDEWSPGATPQSTDYPRIDTDGIKALISRLSGLATDLRESTANLLRTAGIFLTKTGMRIGSSLTVEGDLASTGSASFGGNTSITGDLESTGSATFGGDVTTSGRLSVAGLLRILASAVVTGNIRSDNYVAGVSGWQLTASGLEVNDITIRGGIIGNDALSSPLVHGSVGKSEGGFAVGTVATARASTTISVPAGFSKATILCVTDATVVIGTTPGGYASLRASIAGVSGGTSTGFNQSGEYLPLSASAIRTMTGLNGGSITVSAVLSSFSDQGSNASNLANVNAIAIFTR